MNNPNFIRWCVLEDCNHPECHHCFPVKNCSKNHPECINGTCPEIFKDMELKILVTGCAGFIGSHVCEHLLKRGNQVLGIDNLNDYYDVTVKQKNLEVLNKYPNFQFRKEDICDTTSISDWKPHKICHLASMAGVRYSIQNPHIYDKVNIGGFIHILEESHKNKVKQIVYASSSSVYGLNTKVPFSEDDPIKTCNSPYACSKMAMELYAKTYHQLYDLNTIGLRFFTVYGPRGRPDMAPYKFIKAIMDGTKFQKYGDGSSSRDYTYVDDIVSGVVASIDNKKEVKSEVYNLGNSNPVSLNQFIELCEKVTEKKALFDQIENQLGDVPHTYADISKAQRDLDYQPKTSLEDGLKKLYLYLK
ncbi:GDP-mannose 4,6 dehydratase [seawater metagenome]|uniref:GDP-mannose 4,6 dehydratase n=1 Tax=seawater metagenome TaxID=1561972 RepID=A0A5E8CI82_9ZZZZ